MFANVCVCVPVLATCVVGCALCCRVVWYDDECSARAGTLVYVLSFCQVDKRADTHTHTHTLVIKTVLYLDIAIPHVLQYTAQYDEAQTHKNRQSSPVACAAYVCVFQRQVRCCLFVRSSFAVVCVCVCVVSSAARGE